MNTGTNPPLKTTQQYYFTIKRKLFDWKLQTPNWIFYLLLPSFLNARRPLYEKCSSISTGVCGKNLLPAGRQKL